MFFAAALLALLCAPRRGDAKETPADTAAAAQARQACDQFWAEQHQLAVSKGGAWLEQELPKEIGGREAAAAKQAAWLARMDAEDAGAFFATDTRIWLEHEQKLIAQRRGELAQLDVSKQAAAEAQRTQAVARQQEAARVVVERAAAERRQLAADAARVDAERKAEQAAERRRRRARPAIERRERPAREERDSSGVRCCDGSMSPTCTTPHRGCCSHHGGLC